MTNKQYVYLQTYNFIFLMSTALQNSSSNVESSDSSVLYGPTDYSFALTAQNVLNGNIKQIPPRIVTNI